MRVLDGDQFLVRVFLGESAHTFERNGPSSWQLRQLEHNLRTAVEATTAAAAEPETNSFDDSRLRAIAEETRVPEDLRRSRYVVSGAALPGPCDARRRVRRGRHDP